MSQIEFIDIRLIDESPLNPRKNVDENSIIELSENIKRQGLLQPITVRVYPGKSIVSPKELKGKTCYQIVCGARRYKACIKADMQEIPAIIREMTDEEAFDAMITENLQRKDVEPMDEARAFNELHKRGTSFEELAARFGKSVSFIRLRIKLNDLVPEFVEMLDKKELQISHAQELCKLTVEHQTALFKEKYSESVQSYYKWNEKAIKDIKNYIQNDFVSLDNAVFDKTGCYGCELRCGSNALFSEYSENKCTNRNCFDEKVKQHYFSLIEEKVSKGYLLVRDESLNSDMESICEELEKSYTIIKRTYKNSDFYSTPEVPEREEDDTDEEWDEAMTEYNEEVLKENERLENGFQRALKIGWGHISEIIIKFNEETPKTPEENIAQQSIKDLQSKDKRNAEIKVEKTYEDQREFIRTSNYQELPHPITRLELAAMYAAMIYRCDYTLQREIEKEFDKEKSYLENCAEFIDSDASIKVIRAFIKNYITVANTGLKDQLSAIANEAFPDDAKRIELKHEETYLKRKESIEKQIKEIEK